MEYFKDEMVQVDDDAIEDLINQCIDSEIDVETKREELEALPSVESVEILEMETIVHFVSGEVVYYPYAFPSIFDQEDAEEPASSPSRAKNKEKEAPTKASGYVAADVAIFNMFSEDSGRKNQNKLVENTKAVFERAGKSVHIYGCDDFIIDNLVKAIDANAIIFVSTLGTQDGRILLGQKKMDLWGSMDYKMYINDFNVKKYDGHGRYTTDIVGILKDKHYSGPLVYLASCYTKPNNDSNLNLVGWNGVNKVGQAYGLIIADYLANWGKTFQAFSIDFSNEHTPSGTIIDPLETNTKLIHYGNGWSGSSRDGWTELKYDNKVVIDQPTPGTCNKKLKYTVKLSYRNDGSIVTDGKSATYENGNKYYFEYTDLGSNSGNWRTSDPLRFKNDVAEYKVKDLTAGVWRFKSYCNTDDPYYGDYRNQDCTYAIFSHSFKENDVQEDDTPSVVTLGNMSGTENLVLGGAVINRSLAGLETGFEYWKKSSPTNKSTVSTTATYEDYFGATLQLSTLNGEYEFRAFATDEENRTGYGDIQSFKYGDSSQQEYATPEAVDLGLPSGLKWASFNLGATAPEEYGDYFAWGDTKSRNDYSFYWDNYRWCNGSEYSLTKYCSKQEYGNNGFVDNKTCLELPDDAARESLGGGWRMPTKNEWDELINNCVSSFESINGRNGIKMVSKINGAWIFIPAAGQRNNDIWTNMDLMGDYWSSTLDSEKPSHAYEFGFYQTGQIDNPGIVNLNILTHSWWDRKGGHTIRPVFDDSEPEPEMKIPEAIDLGLSVKWASFNLGATKPAEYGNYYAWGETQSKNNYTWGTYRWCNGSENSLTKYYYGDGKTSLESADDAVQTKLGDKWRMPTEKEWRELIDNCTWTASSSGGINGMLARSKKTGAELFFPFSGQKDGGEIKKVGSTGYYWTATLNPFESLASIGTTSPDIGYLERYYGLAIRPVYGEANSGTEYNTPEAIDLGLSVKWASFNLGATKPEENGDYFAWGETEPYYSSLDPLTWRDGKEAGYDWASYKWCMGSVNTLTKYCNDSAYGYNGFTDGKTVLDLEDDAAHVILGDKWRMPTDTELRELSQWNCTWEGTTMNGVQGSKVTGPNGNSIFIPWANYLGNSYSFPANTYGFLWSSSRDGYSFYGKSLVFGSYYYGPDYVHSDINFRFFGFSIRPVYDDK